MDELQRVALDCKVERSSVEDILTVEVSSALNKLDPCLGTPTFAGPVEPCHSNIIELVHKILVLVEESPDHVSIVCLTVVQEYSAVLVLVGEEWNDWSLIQLR